MEDQRSKIKRPTFGIYNLLLGSPPGRAQLADHLDEAAR
jgi:hypothetical protein